MGKDFKKELNNLGLIYESARKGDIAVLTKFLARYKDSFFYAIGSGGSYTIAAVFEELCIKAGWSARAITPLMLSKMTYQLQNSAAVLFSASGANHDSRNAYRYLAESEPKGILTCCMRENAAIKKDQRTNLHNFYFEYRMPVVKDGYLAVESIISELVLLSRAFAQVTGKPFFECTDTGQFENLIYDQEKVRRVLSRETLIVLHGGITTPAAIDLESKFSEVSLGNVQVVDFRNFAHGRHFWLSDRRDSTAIIVLAGDSEKKLADKTIGLLDQEIPVLRLDVTDSKIEGLLTAFRFVFELVAMAGEYRQINPGKPHVEEFGKRLYHLNFNICNAPHMTLRRKNLLCAATYRKSFDSQGQYEKLYLKSAKKYWENLASHRFRGMIFDYDGTLHDKNRVSATENEIFLRLNELLENGIFLGIATGRGKSVRTELQGKIEEIYWDRVLIAYYNGGALGWLSDDSQPNKAMSEVPEAFNRIREYMDNDLEEGGVMVEGLKDHNPYQLTILLNAGDDNSFSLRKLRDFIHILPDVKLLESSHSIDVIPITSSKNNIFARFCQLGLEKEDFLVFGDSGMPGGNDFELLKSEFSLSVDSVSVLPDSCWNFSKPGDRNLDAMLAYLKDIEIMENGFFRLKG